ncbi:MAG: hypothetical protein ACM3VS_01010 [Candidatus Dadabacteria bacterium]
MTDHSPLKYTLSDGTRVEVYHHDNDSYEFILKRLNSEEHNFLLVNGRIEESYETRFDKWQNEAVEIFRQMELQDR